jgi:hypothetical protein
MAKHLTEAIAVLAERAALLDRQMAVLAEFLRAGQEVLHLGVMVAKVAQAVLLTEGQEEMEE